MQSAGLEFLTKHHNRRVKEGKIRMGFHRPRHNSQFHLHLHLIVGDLLTERHEKIYGMGTGLVSVERVFELYKEDSTFNQKELLVGKIKDLGE